MLKLLLAEGTCCPAQPQPAHTATCKWIVLKATAVSGCIHSFLIDQLVFRLQKSRQKSSVTHKTPSEEFQSGYFFLLRILRTSGWVCFVIAGVISHWTLLAWFFSFTYFRDYPEGCSAHCCCFLCAIQNSFSAGKCVALHNIV